MKAVTLYKGLRIVPNQDDVILSAEPQLRVPRRALRKVIRRLTKFADDIGAPAEYPSAIETSDLVAHIRREATISALRGTPVWYMEDGQLAVDMWALAAIVQKH